MTITTSHTIYNNKNIVLDNASTHLVIEHCQKWQLFCIDKLDDLLSRVLAIKGRPSLVKLLEEDHAVESGLQRLGYLLIGHDTKVKGVLRIGCSEESLGVC